MKMAYLNMYKLHMNHWVKAECIRSVFAALPDFLSKETIDDRPVEDSGSAVVSRSYHINLGEDYIQQTRCKSRMAWM